MSAKDYLRADPDESILGIDFLAAGLSPAMTAPIFKPAETDPVVARDSTTCV